MTSTPTREQVHRAPKVLLHDHLDGGLRPSTVIELAHETGHRGLPTEDPDALGAWFRSGADRKSLELYLEGFSHTVGVMQTPDAIARVGGSWGFIIAFGLFLCFWAVINTVILTRDAFDPYPFIFLNLILSMLAAVQAPVIMMSQNRQAAKDRLSASKDYEVNLKSEVELIALHHKIDTVLLREIAELRGEVTRLCNQLAAAGQSPDT